MPSATPTTGITPTIIVPTKTITPTIQPTSTIFVNWLTGKVVNSLVAEIYPVAEGTGGIADCEVTTPTWNTDIFIGAKIFNADGTPYGLDVPVGGSPIRYEGEQMIVESHRPMMTELLQAETDNPNFTHSLHFPVNVRDIRNANKVVDWVLWQVDQVNDPSTPPVLLPHGQINGICRIYVDKDSVTGGSGSSGDGGGDSSGGGKGGGGNVESGGGEEGGGNTSESGGGSEGGNGE